MQERQKTELVFTTGDEGLPRQFQLCVDITTQVRRSDRESWKTDFSLCRERKVVATLDRGQLARFIADAADVLSWGDDK